MPTNDPPVISARTQVEALAAAGVGRDLSRVASLQVAPVPEGATPRSVEGPYYVPTAEAGLTRRDIRAGQPGIPLTVRLTVLDDATRRPLPGATVDVWHCDARGYYSGHHGTDPDAMPPLRARVPPEKDDHSRDLRGTQVADESGVAEFATVYPGWYWGRAIHIHVKVWTGGTEVYTGQLYLPDDVNAVVATLPPYDRHTAIERVPNDLDGVYQQTDGAEVVLAVRRRSSDSVADGFIATYSLVVVSRPA